MSNFRRSLYISACAATAFVATTLQAAPANYVFDKAHTSVHFSVSHLGFSQMQGRFHEIDGGFVFDEENIGQSSVELTINTTSVDMDVEALNEHLRTADFFNVEQFPTMTFKSTSTKKTGDNTGEITGDFTLLGVTHPVTLNVVFNRAAEHPSTKKYTAGFSATGSLKRSDFGMTTGVPFLGDQIEISIQVEGQRVE